MLHTYLICGFTSQNADFEFKYTSDSMLNPKVIQRALLANVKKGTNWYAAIEALDPYCLSMDEERSDLRDSDSQRVYLFDDVEALDEGNEDAMQRFMVTVDDV